MARRIVTREDVAAAQGALVVGPHDVITQAARDLAKRTGVTFSEQTGAVAATPTPAPAALRPAAPEAELAVVTAVGRNRPHVLAEITARIAALEGNVQDISQRIVGDYFSLILTVDLASVPTFGAFKAELEALSREGDYRVVVQHERIFRAMHRL